MKTQTFKKEGVVAEYNGQYWGIQHGDAYYTFCDFGSIDKAEIYNPEFCTRATEMTYEPFNTNNPHSVYRQLEKARLVKVTKNITYEIEE